MDEPERTPVSLPPLYAFVGDPRSRPHYARHIEPVAKALRARGHEITLLQPGRTPPMGSVVLVAGHYDVHALAGRHLIHIEHGAGQHYGGDPAVAASPGFAGGAGYDQCILFLTPNEVVADRWRAAYPDTPAVAVGCPALDRWHQNPPTPTKPRIALTFHWPSALCPESGTAWGVYSRQVSEVLIPLALKEGWSVVGHEHPRWQGQLMLSWKAMGVPTVSYDEVMETATLLVADNTSMLPEFASTGRPVLWLNSPEWRPDVRHGGRFYDWPRGQIVCEAPQDLGYAVANAMLDAPAVRRARDKMVADVYIAVDGKATERAVEAIETHVR